MLASAMLTSRDADLCGVDCQRRAGAWRYWRGCTPPTRPSGVKCAPTSCSSRSRRRATFPHCFRQIAIFEALCMEGILHKDPPVQAAAMQGSTCPVGPAVPDHALITCGLVLLITRQLTLPAAVPAKEVDRFAVPQSCCRGRVSEAHRCCWPRSCRWRRPGSGLRPR